MVFTYADNTTENIPDTLLDCEAVHVLRPELWPFRHTPEYLGDYVLLANYIETYTEICEGNRQTVGALPLSEFYALKAKLDKAEFNDFATGTCFEMVLEIAQLRADFTAFYDNYKKALEVDLNNPAQASGWHLKYEDFNTLMSLSEGDCTKFEAILSIDAATAFTTLAYKAEQAKEQRKLMNKQ
jgi:hypothetical protein